MKALITAGKSASDIYEALAIKDIQLAADVMRSVYDATGGRDGYVSLEVSPFLANDTPRTVAEARRLYQAVGRPNVMIKIPATAAGLPAITETIAAGVNVNVTLIFALANYQAVADAYMAGLERLSVTGPSVTGGHPANAVASVASFFVSRVDSAVDKELEKRGASDLQGKIAIANCKLAYAEFKRITASPRWKTLALRGARAQRVLWGSTSTKNPAYPDTLYVDELIGPDTVNTMPPETVKAFIDHGRPSETLTQDRATAQKQVGRLAELGIDFDGITRRLQEEGVAAFAKPFQALMDSIDAKRRRLMA